MSADGGCIFCRIAGKNVPSKVLFEDDELLAFADLKPQAPLHALVVPKRHIEKASDLAGTDAALAGRMLLAAKDIAEKAGFGKSGYRMVLNCGGDAGQAVAHIHLHVMGGRKFSWPPG
jgi:histidine triad (HIT) family protein